MAELATPQVAAPLPTAEEVKAANDAVARKVAGQDITGHSMSPVDTGVAGDALDNLAKQISEKNNSPDLAKPAVPDPTKSPDPANPVKVAVPDPAVKLPDPVPETVKEIFKNSPSLPPGVSPKSAEAFASVKETAFREILSRDQEIEKLKADIAKREEATKVKSPEQEATEKELQQLREFRAKMDVDFDPQFKAFDAKVEASRDFIYAQLRKSPVVTEEVIDTIKKFGGPDRANLSALFEAAKDPQLQRIVESQLAEIVKVQYEKDKVVLAAKENLTQYLSEREKSAKDSIMQHVQATSGALEKYLGALDWFKEKPATEADAADHNKFVTELRSQLNEALSDNSAEMRAVLITGVAQYLNLQRTHKQVTAENETLKKENTELKDKWGKIKQASTSRLSESQASPNPAPPKPDTQINTRTSDALDNLAQQVMAERQRVGQS
jgi:hypothetical protein